MKSVMRSCIIIVLLAITLSFSGCASYPVLTPNYMASDFGSLGIHSISCVPVLDFREDRSKPLNLDAWVLKVARIVLTKRGYHVSILSDRKIVAPLQTLPSAEMVDRAIAGFKPNAGARWVMVFCLVHARAKLTFGSTANAEMKAYIVDTQKGAVVWRDDAIGQSGQGGLLGMTMKGLMEETAIQTAADKLTYAVPPAR